MQNAPLQTRSDSQTQPYRWPQKVHRYGLMQHPFLRLFVALYENQVPWNKRPHAWCPESLREHIRAEMLPALKPVPPNESTGTAFGDDFYLRRINLDAALHEAEDPCLEDLQAERVHNPQAAYQKAIEYFNWKKHAAFKDWWQVMNEHYEEYPEWIYCVLKRIFATSDRDSRAPAPAVRLATVEKLAAAVVREDISPSVGLSGVYLLMDAGMDTDQSLYNKNGWTRIAIDDPRSSLNQKIQLLSYFGHRAGWCIEHQGTASSYLSRSDFYVLCVDASPKLAIRCRNKSSGDSSSLCVEEVTGVSNRRVRKNAAVDLLIAVLKEKTHIRKNKKLQTRSNLACLDRDEWQRVLEIVPFALHLAPGAVRNSNSIREKACAAKLRYILHDPFWIPYALRKPSCFESLGVHMHDTLASALRRMPMLDRYLGKALLRHPRLRTAWEEGWIQHLKEKATTIDVPRRILAAPEIRPLAMDAFRMDLACAPVPPRFHAFYKEDPGLLEEYRQAWIRYLQQTKNPAAQVPNRFWNDKHIVSAWSAAHMDAAKRGRAPETGAAAGMMREAWYRLCVIAVKAFFANPENTTDQKSFMNPKVAAALTEVRSAVAEAYIALLLNAVASQNPANKTAIVGSASLGTLATADMRTHPARGFSRGNSAEWDPMSKPAAASPTACTMQSAVHALATKTAVAFFERLALHGNALGLEIPPTEVAGNPELSREWTQQWPRKVVDQIPVENFSHVIGCTELGIPAAVWDQPAGRLVHRELVLRFLASRGAGRPLATNDALPKAFANDPGMHEIWIAAWERILRTMPREYAVYRRVALNVQDTPRVFWAWLHAVRPLNRLLEEEEAWRTFLLVKSGDPLPPFLPRLEIFERNANLRSLVRERLRRNDLQNRTRPTSAGGDFEDFQDFITQGMRSLLSGTAFHLARNAPPQTADFELLRAALSLAGTTPEDAEHSGPRDASEHALWVEASNVLRASPWLIETLPAESARNPAFHEAVLSGWNAYLDVAPWLLPWIPAAWRRHFLKTRSGCRRIPPPPAHTPRKPLCAAA